MTQRRRPSGYTQPADWQSTVRRILNRDGRRCYLCNKLGATSVDHVKPVAEGGAHDDANLKAVHPSPCHARKTERERSNAIKRRARRRQPRPHPNLIAD